MVDDVEFRITTAFVARCVVNIPLERFGPDAVITEFAPTYQVSDMGEPTISLTDK